VSQFTNIRGYSCLPNVLSLRRRMVPCALMVCAVLAMGPGCQHGDGTNTDGTSDQGTSGPRNDLETMEQAELTIDEHTFQVWVASKSTERQTGLMNVHQEEMADLEDGRHRGMLFVFEVEDELSFWMRNTIIPLDIAYIRTDGVIVKTYTVAPLETRLYPSEEPARYALEVSAGLFEQLNIKTGDRVEIPDSLLNQNQQ